MFKQLYHPTPGNSTQGIDIVRIGVAFIILMHPLRGFLHPADIPQFGGFLESLGYSFGTQLAWTVLIVQTVCSIALLCNRFVVLGCLGHIVVVSFGLIHFHAPNGWFVVGGGTGGMEWPVILLSSLVGVLWAHWPRNKSA